MGRGILVLAILASSALSRAGAQAQDSAGPPIAPDSVAAALLVDVRALDPAIAVEARYATANNFTGAPLPGYEANRVLLRREAAAALARVERRLAARGLGLKVFDGYRPVRATRAMVDWARRTGRAHLVEEGYIAARSRHNLGLAVDLTLVDRLTGAAPDMGTPYDDFSEAAHTANASGEVARRRQLLVDAMSAEGFVNYEKEWWHFSYQVAGEAPAFDLVVR